MVDVITAPPAKYPQVVTIDGDIGGSATVAPDPVVQISPGSQIEINLRSVTPQNRVARPSTVLRKP